MRRAVCLFALLAAPLHAQTLFPRLTVRAAFNPASFDTNVRIDPGTREVEGTRINLERDLGLPESRRLKRFEIAWRPFERHELAVGYFNAGRNAAQHVNREIVFRDETYPVNAFVSTRFDIGYWNAAYTYWAHRTTRSGVGITLGAAAIKADAYVRATRPLQTVTITEQANTDVPVALGGVQARAELTDRLHAKLAASALPRLTIRGYTGRAFTGDAALEYRLTNWLALGAAYDYFRLDVDVADGDIRGAMKMKIRGPEAFIRLGF